MLSLLLKGGAMLAALALVGSVAGCGGNGGGSSGSSSGGGASVSGLDTPASVSVVNAN